MFASVMINSRSVGFPNLITPLARTRWLTWIRTFETALVFETLSGRPPINHDSHYLRETIA